MVAMTEKECLIEPIRFEPVHESDLDELVECVQGTYPGQAGELMLGALGIQPLDYLAFAGKVCDRSVADGMTIVARDVLSGRIVGFCISRDFATAPEDREEATAAKILPVLDLQAQLEGEYRVFEACEPGEIWQIYMLGVLPQFTRRNLGKLLVGEALASSQDSGYRSVVAHASNAFSQKVCLAAGFDRCSGIAYQDYAYLGKPIFAGIHSAKECLFVEKCLDSGAYQGGFT